MKKLMWIIALTSGMITPLCAQGMLRSGPMLGYATMREVAVWVQTTQATEVQLVYWDTLSPSKKYKSLPQQTELLGAYSTTLVADSLEPGHTYTYSFMIGGTYYASGATWQFTSQTLWQWRVDPPAFTVALGSCTYVNETDYDRPGTPYGSDYQVFGSIAAKAPACMIWLGDNVYLREADYFARSSIFDRYTHTRSLPEMQGLLSATHHYAIWDDHDYGPDNANGSYFGKNYSREAFTTFWPSTVYGMGDTEGTTSFFSWNDIDFFLLDDRWYRSAVFEDPAKREILGQKQVAWLIAALKTSQSPYKIVCVGSQFLNTADSKENFSTCPSERAQILDAIQREHIRNVVFVTGDRHHTELSKYSIASLPTVWDLTVSPLTSGVHSKASEETNALRVEGSLITQHNFGTLEFTGDRKNRKLTVHIYDSNGNALFDYEIPRE